MSKGAKRAAVKIILAFLGVLVSWTATSYAFVYFTANGVTSDYATGYSIIVFLVVLVALWLAAFKVNL